MEKEVRLSGIAFESLVNGPGHTLSREDIKQIGKIDLLLIPIGGNYTIDGKEAAEIAKAINSHIVLPMHYKTPLLSFQLEGLEDFLSYMKSGERIGGNQLSIDGPLEGFNKVAILDYK